MPIWTMVPKDGSEAHEVITSRGKRPADEGYDESQFTVTRQRRAMRPHERISGGKRITCPVLATNYERDARIAEIGLHAWLDERIEQVVSTKLDDLGLK